MKSIGRGIFTFLAKTFGKIFGILLSMLIAAIAVTLIVAAIYAALAGADYLTVLSNWFGNIGNALATKMKLK